MTFVVGLLAVIAVVSSLLLGFVVLLQEPKGGGLAAAMAGGSMGDFVGPRAGTINRFTMYVAGVWIASCFLLAVLA